MSHIISNAVLNAEKMSHIYYVDEAQVNNNFAGELECITVDYSSSLINLKSGNTSAKRTCKYFRNGYCDCKNNRHIYVASELDTACKKCEPISFSFWLSIHQR